MVTRKYKKQKPNKGAQDKEQMNQVKEPFIYNEEVQWIDNWSGEPIPPLSVSRDMLNKYEAVYPFGYPTEQFLQ